MRLLVEVAEEEDDDEEANELGKTDCNAGRIIILLRFSECVYVRVCVRVYECIKYQLPYGKISCDVDSTFSWR